MLRLQIRIPHQYETGDVHIRVIDGLETADDRAAHQCHFAPVVLGFLMCVDSLDRHEQVQLHYVPGLPAAS